MVRAGIVEESEAKAVVVNWSGSEGSGCVEKSEEEDGLLNMSGTGVYGMKSHADLVCDGVTNCRASAAWIQMRKPGEFPLAHFAGHCEEIFQRRRRLSEKEPNVSGAQRKVVAPSICKEFEFGFHNPNDAAV